MSNVEPNKPEVLLATQDWTLRQIMDTENRIERAFHEQTQFLNSNMDSVRAELHQQTHQMNTRMHQQTLAIIVAMLTIGAGIIAAVFFK